MLKTAEDSSWTDGRGPYLFQIGLATFAILALEVALIRWMSGQIRLFAYLNNLILIGCFLGMGLGVAIGSRKPGFIHWSLPALCVLCIPFTFAGELGWMQMGFPDPSIHLWGAEETGAPLAQFLYALVVILVLFAGLVAVFIFAGSAVGCLLAKRANLQGYSADLIGSLLGVLAISVVTAFNLRPPIWFLVGCLPLLWLSRTPLSFLALGGTLFLVHLSVAGAIFSPYNRIDVKGSEFGPSISVNRDFHQYIHDFSDPKLSGSGSSNPKARIRQVYDMPFVLSDRKERALVIGAGTGNDVQAALRNGIKEVYAVDIDGQILKMGERLHPEKPYADSRVTRFLDDGRAFFEQYNGEGFDVVCFGLVDSHAMFSAHGILRLDNYIYTKEGLRAAWEHVAPGGVMTVSFSIFGGPWIAQRLYWTIVEATGVRPMVINHGLHHAATHIVPKDMATIHPERIETFPVIPASAVVKTDVRIAQDDWPFLYMRPGVIPWGYMIILTSVLMLAVLGTRLAYRKEEVSGKFDPALFLMGAAFMLLETRGMTSLSLLFGSTWIVNSSVIAGILVMALIANILVQRRPSRNLRRVFLFLLGSVVLLWLIDLSVLNRLPLVARWIVGSLFHALPIGFAGFAVSTFLARAKNLSGALASNLLGSVLGGCLEYLCIWSGLRSLLVIAFALYLGAYLYARRETLSAAGDGVL